MKIAGVLAFLVAHNYGKEVISQELKDKIFSDLDAKISKGDPCARVNGNQAYAMKDVVECYKIFPFQSAIRDATLDTIWKFLPFYAFSDVARKRSVDIVKLDDTKDIESSLSILRTKNYDSDYEFQMDVKKVFNGLMDGHSVFLPACYQMFSFMTPFPLMILKEGKDDKLVVKVASLPFNEIMAAKWKSLGISPKEFGGATVLKINGQDPFEALLEFADVTYGTSRDRHARVNAVLTKTKLNNGTWINDYGLFATSSQVPQNEYVKMELNIGGKVKSVDVPYLAANGVLSFKNAKQYYQTNCLAEALDLSSEALHGNTEITQNLTDISDSSFELTNPIPMPKSLSVPLPKHKHRKWNRHHKKSLDLSKPLVNGQFVQFFQLSSDVGVIVIPTFDDPTAKTFLSEFGNGLTQFKAKGIKKLIIDVSNNGGGTACLYSAVLRFFMPVSQFKPFRLDMHMNPLLTNLMMVDNLTDTFNPSLKFRPNGTYYQDFLQLMPKGNERADVENRYTNFFSNDCKETFILESLKDNPDDIPYQHKDIALISNSLCYSTCGLFVNDVQELTKIDTFALGGTQLVDNKLPTAGSMNGANVVALDGMIQILAFYNLTDHPLSPKQLPLKSHLGVTLMQAYSHFPDEKGDPIPLEFLGRRANNHLYYTLEMVSSPQLVWEKVAELKGFGKFNSQENPSVTKKLGNFIKRIGSKRKH